MITQTYDRDQYDRENRTGEQGLGSLRIGLAPEEIQKKADREQKSQCDPGKGAVVQRVEDLGPWKRFTGFHVVRRRLGGVA